MPRGFGRGDYWWHHGRGMNWQRYPAGYTSVADIPKDAVYVGPCRCGHGPHAYYRLADGEVVHAASLPYPKEAEEAEPQPAHDELEAEVESLRSRVQELEKKLKDARGAGKR